MTESPQKQLPVTPNFLTTEQLAVHNLRKALEGGHCFIRTANSGWPHHIPEIQVIDIPAIFARDVEALGISKLPCDQLSTGYLYDSVSRTLTIRGEQALAILAQNDIYNDGPTVSEAELKTQNLHATLVALLTFIEKNFDRTYSSSDEQKRKAREELQEQIHLLFTEGPPVEQRINQFIQYLESATNKQTAQTFADAVVLQDGAINALPERDAETVRFTALPRNTRGYVQLTRHNDAAPLGPMQAER